MATDYYLDTQFSPMLLRRDDFDDKAFRDGTWVPTKVIIDWSFGHYDFVERISEDEARERFPQAFGVEESPAADASSGST